MTFAEADFAPAFHAVNLLGDDATLLLDRDALLAELAACPTFAAACDERRDAWADDLDAATDH